MNWRGVFTSVLLCGALFGQSAAPFNQPRINAASGSMPRNSASKRALEAGGAADRQGEETATKQPTGSRKDVPGVVLE
jgi:hypothetical protein